MELTREQDTAVEALAEKYGSCAVRRQRADGAVLATGLTQDVERRTVWIDTEGRELAPQIPVAIASGYRVFVDGTGSTGTVTAEMAAAEIANGLRTGRSVRLVVHGQDGAERAATTADVSRVLRHAG